MLRPGIGWGSCSELAGQRVGLAQLGPDAAEIADIVREGVRDAARDFVRDYLRDAVQDIVTVSTRDTERRITEHMDEAVLGLAQALLHRRPALGAGITSVDEVAVNAGVSLPDAAPNPGCGPASQTAPELGTPPEPGHASLRRPRSPAASFSAALTEPGEC